MEAVLTGEILHLSLLDSQQTSRLGHELVSVLSPYRHAFFRSDRFQAYFPDARPALRVALLCRTAAMRLLSSADLLPDVACQITVFKQPETEAGREQAPYGFSEAAFENEGVARPRLSISCGHSLGDMALGILADYMQSLFGQLTSKQAEVIHFLLLGDSQQAVSNRLQRSKSTISQHVAAARWPEISQLLLRFSSIMDRLD